MHLMIPYASTLDDAGLHALRQVQLPNLSALLGLLGADDEILGSDELAPRMPHELVLDSRPVSMQANSDTPRWAHLTPMHFFVSTDQVTALDPELLQLTDQESQDFLEALAPLFDADEGWQRQWQGALDWRIAHAQFQGLERSNSASLDRVINRSLTPWMPQAPVLRRLLNEIQMSLHNHPLNLAREARGQLPVNSVWVADIAALANPPLPDLQCDARLRPAWRAGDWRAWAEAWQSLDEGPIRALHEAVLDGASTSALSLTLSGERFARRFTAQARSPVQRLWHRFKAPKAKVHAVLEAL